MTRRAAAVGLAAAGLLAACGGGESAVSSSSSRAATSASGSWAATSAAGYEDSASVARFTPDTVDPAVRGLPPRSFDDLAAIYAPIVEPMGLRLTRAAVIRLEAGPHLQVYVEPTGTAISPPDYIDRIVPLAKAIAPSAFATYPALASFDVCQEPPPGVDDAKEPPPDTVLVMRRAQVEAVQWDAATLRDLRRVTRDLPGGQLKVADELAAVPAWTAAEP